MNRIAIFNQKGGVGKSSMTVNLSAVLFKLLKKKILIVDCDAQANSSSYFLAYGYEDEVSPTLVDFLNGDAVLEDCLYPVYFATGSKNTLQKTSIDILPVDARLDDIDFTDMMVLKKIADSLSSKYDYCFFDCSPQKTPGVLLALCASDYVVVPMDSGDLDSVQGWNMVLSLVDEIKENGVNNTIRILGVVVNFYNRVRSVHGYMLGVFKDTFGDALFNTTIRDSADIEQAKMFRKPVCYYKPSCPVTKDYEKLAMELNKRVEAFNRKVGK